MESWVRGLNQLIANEPYVKSTASSNLALSAIWCIMEDMIKVCDIWRYLDEQYYIVTDIYEGSERGEGKDYLKLENIVTNVEYSGYPAKRMLDVRPPQLWTLISRIIN